MDVALHQIATTSDGTYCYVHARGLLLPQGKGLITLQKLDLSGCDLFDGIEMMKTSDGGKSFSPPRPCEKLRREYFENGISRVMCDATPFFHQKTKKILLTGHTAWYNEKGKILCGGRPIKGCPLMRFMTKVPAILARSNKSSLRERIIAQAVPDARRSGNAKTASC